MTDYISREDALNFEMEIEADPEEIEAISRGMALMSEYIKGLPAVDVVPRKKAKWKLEEDLLTWEGTFDGYFCSECGKGYLTDLCCGNGEHYVEITKEFHFCPNCGADMRGADDV